MNKQEAIEIIEQSKIKIAKRENVIFKAGEIIGECVQVDYVPLEAVVTTINQIDEPQRVVVPKFVAGWLEWCKENSLTLSEALSAKENKSDDLQTAVNEWFTSNHEDLFARAWLDGYQIEQEKLYTVEIPNPNRSGKGHAKFMLEKIGNEVVLVKRKSKECYQNKSNQKLTESEIKEDFEWAWQFAKEVE